MLFTNSFRYTFYFFHFSSPFYSGPQKDAEKSPNHGTYFDFALGISYKVLFPVLDRPTAQFKTACTKFRNVIELSTDIVKQIWNIFCEWEIIRHLFSGPSKIKSKNWDNKVNLMYIDIPKASFLASWELKTEKSRLAIAFS